MECVRMMWIIVYVVNIKYIYSDEDIPACSSPIYCHGELLDTVQRAEIFSDSKTFVDMSLKDSPENVIKHFNEMIKDRNITTEDIRRFVDDNFDGPGEEFEIWQPSDYVRNPKFLENISDQVLQDFGWDMCAVWKDLGRKVKLDVKHRPDRYSLIYLPNPIIVPGGRFRETYYWDSFWVVRGLLVCEMNITVKGMLENFFKEVKKLGLVPNGGRIYYSLRSQPPFLIPMVNEYFEQTNDLDLLRNNIDIMEEEYNFWMTNRTVTAWYDGRQYTLNRYAPRNNQPRPESYREDFETAKGLSVGAARKLYNNLVATAESGWDFSSRWYSRDNPEDLSLNSTVTTDIIPVDLNSILCMNERLLAKFYKLLGNTDKENEYIIKLGSRIEAVNSVLWNSNRGIWQDLYISDNTSRDYYYPSNIYPMFTGCLEEDIDMRKQKEQNAVKYLKEQNILQYDGGVPTSHENTGQQWDFTNGWPPLQHVMIWSLKNSVLTEANDIAELLAQRWISSNWKGWERTRNMFEKYDVSNPGSRGGGGEYNVQEGFGWTNGVVLDILQTYGDKLSLPLGTGQCNKQMTPFSTQTCPVGCTPNTNSSRRDKIRLTVLVFTVMHSLLIISFSF